MSKSLLLANTEFHHLPEKYPGLTKPSGASKVVKHSTVHCINTILVFIIWQTPPISSWSIANSDKGVLRHGAGRNSIPSYFSWASNLNLAPKKNVWRTCGDYRALNARNILNRYLNKHIEDCSQILASCKIFSKLDLVKTNREISMAP